MAPSRWISLTLLLAAGIGLAHPSPSPEESPLKVERLDPAADAILPAAPVLHKLATGYTWTEGPIWIPAGYLLFADIPSNTIRKVVPGEAASIFLQPSGYQGSQPFGGHEPGSNGMTLDARGRLTVAGHGQRDVYRIESLSNPAAGHTILADTYQGKRLNSPNDLVYKSDGSLYFTDPPYGLPKQDDSDPAKELKVNGVYRLPGALEQKPGAAPARDRLELLISDLPRPNGIVFSPDEKTLYISNSGPRFWMRYPVLADGRLGPGSLLFNADSDSRQGGPDGIKVDRNANLYSTGPGGIWIFSPAGKHIATILLPEIAANLNWGGANSQTLFITASSSVYSIELKIPGIHP